MLANDVTIRPRKHIFNTGPSVRVKRQPDFASQNDNL